MQMFSYKLYLLQPFRLYRYQEHVKIKVLKVVFLLLQSCEICQEQFETYWVEEEEDWFLKNAIRVDDKVECTDPDDTLGVHHYCTPAVNLQQCLVMMVCLVSPAPE